MVYCQYWVWYLPWVTCSLLWATGNTTNRLTMHNSEQQIIYFWAVFHGNAFSGRTKTINFTVSTCNHFPNKWQFCYKDILYFEILNKFETLLFLPVWRFWNLCVNDLLKHWNCCRPAGNKITSLKQRRELVSEHISYFSGFNRSIDFRGKTIF